MKSLYQFILVWLSVLAYAQPSGACSEGTTRIDASGHLYGCVVDKWIKISEDFDVATATYSTTAASTGLAPSNNNVMLRVGDKNYQLPNRGFVPLLPSAIADAPSHVLGKVFYSKANKHFYQGVDAGKWHQIDNEGFSSTKTGSYEGYFTRNNCGTNYTGSTVTVTRTASGTATSTISQADADSKAQALANNNARALVNAEGQAEANNRGTCTYNPPVTTYTSTKTETVSGSYTRNNCTFGTGSTVTVSRQGTATMTSTISQTDADNKASAEARSRAQAALNREGQAEANNRGTCMPDGAISKIGEIVWCQDGGIKSEYKWVETNIGWFRIDEWYEPSLGFGGCDFVMDNLSNQDNNILLAPYKKLLLVHANCSWTGAQTCDAEGLVIGSTGQLGRLDWIKFHKQR